MRRAKYYWPKQIVLVVILLDALWWLVLVAYVLVNYQRIFHGPDDSARDVGIAFMLFFAQFFPLLCVLLPCYLYATAKPDLPLRRKYRRAATGILFIIAYCAFCLFLSATTGHIHSLEAEKRDQEHIVRKKRLRKKWEQDPNYRRWCIDLAGDGVTPKGERPPYCFDD